VAKGRERSESSSQGKARGVEPDSAYAPVGLAQNDSLRRIGNVLSMEMSNGQKVGAVGILGADIFDKLLICRAIQPILKRQLFFTNNLDAWYWDPDEFRTCAGMIVASPFGLDTLPSGDGRQDSDPKPGGLPFRNSYQASVYWSALEAVTYGHPISPGQGSKNSKANDENIYEIESNGAVLLQDRSNYLSGRRKILCVYLPIVALCVILKWYKKHLYCIVKCDMLGAMFERFAVCRVAKMAIEKVAWFFSPVNFLVLMVLGFLSLSFVTIGNKTMLVLDNRMTSWFYIGLLSVTVTVLLIGIGYLQFPCEIRRRRFEETYGLGGDSRPGLEIVSQIENRIGAWIFLSGNRVFGWGFIVVVSLIYGILWSVVDESLTPSFWAMRSLNLGIVDVRDVEVLFYFATLSMFLIYQLVVGLYFFILFNGIREIDKVSSGWSDEVLRRVVGNEIVACGSVNETSSNEGKALRDYVDLNYLADRTSGFSLLLLSPCVALGAIVFGWAVLKRPPDWPLMAELIVLACPVTVLIFGYVLSSLATRMRDDVIREIQVRTVLRAEVAQSLCQSLRDLNSGIFREFPRQPVVRFIIFGVGLLGGSELLREVFRRL
jgi:hypothetical protein